MKNCPCGSNKLSSTCCLLFISRQTLPETPEQLMRSRYTAYTQGDIDYIIHTMKAPANKDFDPKSALEWARQVKWLGLEVVKTESNQMTGIVEFIARFSFQGKKQILHEVSEFIQENGQWYYVDGKTL